MGSQARGIPFKIAKIILMCAVIWLLLYGLQVVIDFLYDQTDQLRPWWQLDRLHWIKYPLFAIVVFLVFNEKI